MEGAVVCAGPQSFPFPQGDPFSPEFSKCLEAGPPQTHDSVLWTGSRPPRTPKPTFPLGVRASLSTICPPWYISETQCFICFFFFFFFFFPTEPWLVFWLWVFLFFVLFCFLEREIYIFLWIFSVRGKARRTPWKSAPCNPGPLGQGPFLGTDVLGELFGWRFCLEIFLGDLFCQQRSSLDFSP